MRKISYINRAMATRKKVLIFASLVILLTTDCAGLLVARAAALESGIWTISGVDAELGSYTGTLEVREAKDGFLDAIRLVQLERFKHQDGRSVDLAWTGKAASETVRSATLTFPLIRADFITQVGDLVRTSAEAAPIVVTATLQEQDNRSVTVSYTAPDRPQLAIHEHGIFVSPPGEAAIWRPQRFLQETHREPEPGLKRILFDLFKSYHALPALQPYVNDPRFQRAVHFQVIEHTDFDYYRAHPDRLRVVNKVVDAISLAETEVRANAFRASFNTKAAFYQKGLTHRGLVGPHGMVVESIGALGEERPDGDSALWTGVYTYTQALRFKATGDAEALDNLRRSLKGILTLMDITGDPRTFARTLRLAGPPLSGNWRRGTGDFASLDWLAGGNNDMSKGLLLGMIAGWEVLPEGDSLRAAILPHAKALLQLCQFQRKRSAECKLESPNVKLPNINPELPNISLELPNINPGAAELLAGITNDDLSLIDMGLGWLRQPQLLLYAKEGAGPFYFQGISDWSGNHLTLVTTVAIQWLLGQTSDTELTSLWIRASGKAWKVLHRLEHPLHAALAAGLHALTDPKAQAKATDQALWGLRSFPLPKHPYPVDHRIRDDFVMSPYPSLFWKFDWIRNPGRQQSLVAYGMLEHVHDASRWNDGDFAITQAELGNKEVPGVDFLFLYWIARTTDLIRPED
jgi:hypothetical protein